MSCKEGELADKASVQPIVLSSVDVLDYDVSVISIKLIGKVQTTDIAELDQLQVYGERDCSGPRLGQDLVRNFMNDGIEVGVPHGSSLKLAVTTQQSADCIFLQDYQAPSVEPQAPTFNTMTPPSPSRVTTTPGLFGSTYPSTSIVEFYSDSDCTSFLSQGTAQAFASTGIAVSVPENAATTIYGRTKDPLDQVSSCVEMAEFRHSNQMSASPQLVSVSATSPSNFTYEPIIRGTTAPGTVTIELFDDSGCTSKIAEGDPADFETIGFQITGSPNSTINIYAKSEDDLGNPSVCTLLTSFTHDNVAPGTPSFTLANPFSPTNATTLPRIVGSASADTEDIYLYDSSLCLNQIGTGRKTDFEGAGIVASVAANSTTEIYGKAFDGAGNGSDCQSLTSFVHNTIAPGAPLFLQTLPASPNNASTTPFIIGQVAPRTINIQMYKDENCTQFIGQGTSADFEGAGVQVTVDANFDTAIYATVRDQEGNISMCNFLASYSHSNTPAVAPGFFTTFPVSPSNSSNTPFIIGTADSSIATVTLYDDNTCTNELGNGTRGQYISSGIAVNLPTNSTTDIHAIAFDVFGNSSVCTSITTYIHNTVPPSDPIFTTTSPLSPNNNSTTPMITGDVLQNPASQLPATNVAFFDSMSCVSKLGEGTPAAFNSTGIQINVAQNTITSIYAKSFDDAGNNSNCVLMTNYTHNNLVPGAPIFLGANPGSPSFNDEVYLQGTFAASIDFMNRVAVNIYTDSSCTNALGSGTPASFSGGGLQVLVPSNTTTSLYGESVNEVGTKSLCNYLTDFRHHDLAPQNPMTVANVDGSVTINWVPDTVSSPIPTYSVERSINSGGPYTVISSGQISNSFKDIFISDNTQYFYRVFATNSTGRSQYSSEVSITTSAPAPVQAANLATNVSDSQVTLSWSGFPQNMTYRVSRSLSFAGPFTDLGVDTTNSTYLDTGLVNGQTYYYVVTASNPSGDSMQSNIASAVPKATSDEPTELKIMPRSVMGPCGGARGVALSWTAPSYFNTFRLYQGNNKSANNPQGSYANTQTTRCGLGNNDLVYYRVAATWGANDSTLSNVVGFYSDNAPALNLYPGDGEILMSWGTPGLPGSLAGETLLYDVYKSDNYDGPYTKVVTGTTSNSFTDTVANDTANYYYVQAYVIDADTDKIFIAYPSAIRSAMPHTDPNAPANLTLNFIEDQGRVQLDWTPPSHYNGFNVYRATSIGGPYTFQSYVTSPVVLNATLTTGMNYFKVTSVWGNYESTDSNIVSFRNGTVLNLAANPNASDINVTWNNFTGAQDYAIFRSTNLNGPFTEISIEATNNYTDNTAASGVGYYYKVQARFSDLTRGQFSNTDSAMRTDSSNPASVSLTPTGSSSMRADWPGIAGASIYKVEISGNPGGPWINKGSVPINTFNITGLVPRTLYYVRVTATVGVTDYPSALASEWTYIDPSAPSGVVGNNEIDVSWAPQIGAVDYDLMRSTDGVNFSTIASDYPSTTYNDTGVTNGNIYFYKFVVDYGGATRESPISLGYSPGNTPLTPSNLVVENNNVGTEVVLKWSAISGVTSYNIYMATSSGAYTTPVGSSSTPNGRTITGLTTGTTYYFVVTALNGTQESAYSNEVVIVPELEPAAPTAQYFDASTVQLDWTAVAGATQYDIYRSEDRAFFERIDTGVVTNTYQDNTVDPNVTYYYRYQGFNASGAERSISQISDAVNLSTLPQTPLGFFAMTDTNTEVDLVWIQTPSVDGYEIWRSTTQGGPYTRIATPGALDVSYTDSTVVAGNTYYYVIRSMSYSGTPSAYSVERGIQLVGAPANLAAANGTTGIDLTWDALGGVSSYNVRRSKVSGGPYGVITNVATNSYTDTDVDANETYYYVVEGVYASGNISQYSSEATNTRNGFINLQVPIELTDTKMSSQSALSVAFERSMTSFNTNDYDGVTGYEMEVVALNFDVSNRDVALLDSNDIVVGSVTIPASTTNPTRIKAAVTPTVGLETYRVRLDQTSADGELNVYSAKLLVNQANATKTRLYFPLITSDESPNNQDGAIAAYTTSSETYDNYEYSIPFERRADKLNKISDYNAWELEAVVSTTGPSSGIFGLENSNTGQIVEMTETRFFSNSLQLASVPFDEGVANFTNSQNGHLYRLAIRCEFDCQAGSVRVHKAGLWVKLENLTQLRLLHRLTSYQGFVTSQNDYTDERVFIDTSLYTNPVTYFQVSLQDNGSSSANVDLIHHNQDSGSAGLSVHGSAQLSFDSDDLQLQTSGAIVLTSGDRYMTRVTPLSGDVNMRSSSIVIDVGN